MVAAITPWNSPLLLAAWKLAPALAAGNTVVWKPSEFSSVSALEFGQLFAEAGFPPGVVNIVTGFGGEIGDALVTHPKVAKVAFTGGDRTGQVVYEAAARSIKPVTLELGGKSANIVFDDAVARRCGQGRGLRHLRGDRPDLHRRLARADPAPGRRRVRRAPARRSRAPPAWATRSTMRPRSARSRPGRSIGKVLEYIDIAKGEGAACVLGGGPATRPECGQGWFVEPTIFTGVSPDMRIAQEEVFGPVLGIIPFDDDEEAVAIANGTLYGLAAGVWTQSIRRALTMAEQLEAGTVWVNTYRAVSYMSPFGGYKRSGIGRESGQSAIREYLQEKSVWIDISGNVPNPFVLR